MLLKLTTRALLLAGATAAAQPAMTASVETLFRNVRVFDGSGASLSPPTDVLARGNVIAGVGAAARPGAAAVIINGKGRTLMPGLIDNHFHVPLSVIRQEEIADPVLTPAVIEARGAKEAEAMLMRGFTSVRDMGGPMIPIKNGIDKGKYTGPRIRPSGAMISQTSGHADDKPTVSSIGQFRQRDCILYLQCSISR
jgi:imidazolonepropionase-like amidohydrolase